MIKNSTILAMDIFNDVFIDSIVLHIPHSSTYIPEKFISDYINKDVLDNEISLLTDHAVDAIFDINNIDKIIFPYSRVFCDVERFNDDNEILFKFGRGFYYTNTDDGLLFRNTDNKLLVYDEYYLKHHEKLINIINTKLLKNNICVVIDCHSFSDVPFKTDINQNNNRPDFCLGIDDYHTPEWLYKPLLNYLKENNYTVEINNPYSGTLIPAPFLNKNKSVYGIMIEINRKLYMDKNVVLQDKVIHLNNLFSKYFS